MFLGCCTAGPLLGFSKLPNLIHYIPTIRGTGAIVPVRVLTTEPARRPISILPRTRRTIDRFYRFVQAHDVQGIRVTYAELSGAASSFNVVGSVEKASLLSALDILIAKTVGGQDVALMKSIFSNIQAQSDADASRILHDQVFQRLVARGIVDAALRWLSIKPVHINPTREQWHTLVIQTAKRKSARAAIAVLGVMKQLHCPPDSSSFNLIFRALFSGSSFPNPNELRSYLMSMRSRGLVHDPRHLQFLRDSYISQGYSGFAQQAGQYYRNILCGAAFHTVQSPISMASRTPVAEGDVPSSKDVERRLIHTVRKQGKGAALRLYKELEASGFKATQSTLQAILDESYDQGILGFWEDAFTLRADAQTWQRLMRNASHKGGVTPTLTCYNAAISAGICPTTAMLYLALRALCAGDLRPPSDYVINAAFKIYDDFIRLQKGTSEHDGTTFPPVHRPDAPVYNTLLRALSASPNLFKHLPRAMNLLEDMRENDILMDSMASTSVIILLMRSSTNYEEAFNFYKLACQTKEGTYALDEEGFIAVLNAFCKILPGDARAPTSRLYFRIVQDMRTAGHKISSKVYTILLQRLAASASRIASLAQGDSHTHHLSLVETVKRTHKLLLVEACLDPDVPLWNQLMDTYQRLRCYTEALQIWDTLFRTKRFDHASVSIILDCCGFANTYEVATRIWHDVSNSDLRPNRRNWNAWLECLCRVGRLDEAMKVLCLEMVQAAIDVRPDVESVNIVLSFASPDQKPELQERIKQYQPWLWRAMSKTAQ